MTRRILIVEDEGLTAQALKFALGREGYEVEIATSGDDALRRFEQRRPDLVLVDLVLPGGLGGLDLCAELRRLSTVPILVLTARDEVVAKVLALERGADDYVVKPFSLPEVVGRVRALLRRVELDRTVAGAVRQVGDLQIDLTRRLVSVAGRAVHTTSSEFELLSILSEHAGAAVSRDEIARRLWGSEHVGDARTCDAHVRRLRRKLERDPGAPERIVSVRGVGYRLDATLEGG